MSVLSRLLDSEGNRAEIGPGTVFVFNTRDNSVRVVQRGNLPGDLKWPTSSDVGDNKRILSFVENVNQFFTIVRIMGDLLGLDVVLGPELASCFCFELVSLSVEKSDSNVVVTGD